MTERTEPVTRRDLLAGLAGAMLAACASPRTSGAVISVTPEATGASRPLAEIEARVGGRLGVYAYDTGSGKHLAHRSSERFAMCSTFKWALAAAILARIDRMELSLDTRIAYGTSDLLEYAPVTSQHVTEGWMTVDALARAAVTVSDNTAANLLLAEIGGPAGFTKFVLANGDRVTHLDRNEPALNANELGDDRDTTSPRAMVGLMIEVLCRDALSPASRARLLGWLRASETGKNRLRAGFPGSFRVGDKTGTGARGAVNDVAIVVPPGRAPVLVAAYLSDGRAELEQLVAAQADVGRVIARAL